MFTFSLTYSQTATEVVLLPKSSGTGGHKGDAFLQCDGGYFYVWPQKRSVFPPFSAVTTLNLTILKWSISSYFLLLFVHSWEMFIDICESTVLCIDDNNIDTCVFPNRFPLREVAHSCSWLRAYLWRDFQSIRFSVLQNQPWELPSGDPAGEAAHLAACVLWEMELFTGNTGLQTAGISEVGIPDQVTSHHISCPLWLRLKRPLTNLQPNLCLLCRGSAQVIYDLLIAHLQSCLTPYESKDPFPDWPGIKEWT